MVVEVLTHKYLCRVVSKHKTVPYMVVEVLTHK